MGGRGESNWRHDVAWVDFAARLRFWRHVGVRLENFVELHITICETKYYLIFFLCV